MHTTHLPCPRTTIWPVPLRSSPPTPKRGATWNEGDSPISIVMGISGGLQVRNVATYHTRIDSNSSAFSFIIARDSAVPSLKITVFYHPKPSLECYREESKPDLSNKRVVRTIGKTEKKNTVVCFFALRVSFCGNWGWRGGSKIHALPFFSFF